MRPRSNAPQMRECDHDTHDSVAAHSEALDIIEENDARGAVLHRAAGQLPVSGIVQRLFDPRFIDVGVLE